MDLLKFGMENRESSSKAKRALANAALEIVKKQADLYEAKLEREIDTLPEIDTEEMLRNIREEIKKQSE